MKTRNPIIVLFMSIVTLTGCGNGTDYDYYYSDMTVVNELQYDITVSYETVESRNLFFVLFGDPYEIVDKTVEITAQSQVVITVYFDHTECKGPDYYDDDNYDYDYSDYSGCQNNYSRQTLIAVTAETMQKEYVVSYGEETIIISEQTLLEEDPDNINGGGCFLSNIFISN